ncbi:MAG TPA: hypothetical protein VFJ43_09545, partial [Bacteroidia bacterium]|nr:hypothetical protein [Bacteroidia bacterium]
TPQALYYLSIPMKIERTFDGKNAIGLGTSFSYLFNTTSHVETVSVTDGYQMIVGDPKTQHGYFGGLNRFDIAFNLSYRRQLFPKWYLTLEGTYGLMDIKNNSYFTNSYNQTEHLLGGRFLLTYKLF